TWKIRGDHPIIVRKAWNEFAKHERRSRESVKQENYRRAHVARSTIKDANSVGLNALYGTGSRDQWPLLHLRFSSSCVLRRPLPFCNFSRHRFAHPSHLHQCTICSLGKRHARKSAAQSGTELHR